MSQSSDSSTRALAALVTALGITIGATPATLHAQAPATAPSREAVQCKLVPSAVQDKEKAKEAVQDKVGVPAKDAVQKKENAAVQQKVGAQAKVPTAAPAKPI